MARRLDNLLNRLNARRTGPDNPNPLPLEIDRLLRPPRRMNRLAPEVMHTGYIRQGELVQNAHARHQPPRCIGIPVLVGEKPAVCILLVMRFRHPRVELHVPLQIELLDQKLAVSQCLCLAGEMLGPGPFVEDFLGPREAVRVGF